MVCQLLEMRTAAAIANIDTARSPQLDNTALAVAEYVLEKAGTCS